MEKTNWVRAAVLLSLLLLAACTSQPLLQVNDAPVAANRQPVTLNDVDKAIHRAGATLGWQVQTVRPGRILATLHLRTHVAVVDVDYDTRSYSIRYKDSRNLDYTGKTIHRNYNGWIQNLDKAIRAQLMNL